MPDTAGKAAGAAISFSRRGIMGAILAAQASTAFSRLEATTPSSIDRYVDQWVLPELRPMARSILLQSANEAPLSPTTLRARRTLLSGPPQVPDTGTPVAIQTVPVGHGAPDVTVYVINARAGAVRPALLHTHGGGFVAGSAKAAIPSLAALSSQLDCVAVTVEYRLAPETTWQGSVEDNYAALKWLHGNAEALGVDPARIAVMGESAGGGHAAILAISARDRGEVPLAFQCLTYPMLDDRTGSSRPVPDHVGHIIWSASDNRFGWECFLGRPPGGRNVPAAAVPSRVQNLKGLPPAFIGVGSLDLFHCEDVKYAERLNEGGIEAELIVVPGAFHVFDGMPTAISRWFNNARADALRRGLSLTAAPGAK